MHCLDRAIIWTEGGPVYWHMYASPVFIVLTHWCRATHICVSKLTIIGSDKCLSPGRRQAIIWTKDGILLIGPLGTNFSEILSKIHTFSFKKMHLKTSSAKLWPFCLGLNVLNQWNTHRFFPQHSKLPGNIPINVSAAWSSKSMFCGPLFLSLKNSTDHKNRNHVLRKKCFVCWLSKQQANGNSSCWTIIFLYCEIRTTNIVTHQKDICYCWIN